LNVTDLNAILKATRVTTLRKAPQETQVQLNYKMGLLRFLACDFEPPKEDLLSIKDGLKEGIFGDQYLPTSDQYCYYF
jgi:hypothetical protein